MKYKDRVDIIMNTLNHKNGKVGAINTVWVGGMAIAKVCNILGGKYGDTDIKKELNKALEECTKGRSKGYEKIDEVFRYLLNYMINMGTLEDYYKVTPDDEWKERIGKIIDPVDMLEELEDFSGNFGDRYYSDLERAIWNQVEKIIEENK